MNKHCYRVIFNKARGMMMVVSEISRSHNKTSGSSKACKSKTSQVSSQTANYSRVSLKKLALSILCSQALIYNQVYANTSQIQNTANNIAKNQRAILLNS